MGDRAKARRRLLSEAQHETAERGVVFGPDGLDEVVGFTLHAEAARRWFAGLRIRGPHAYAAV